MSSSEAKQLTAGPWDAAAGATYALRTDRIRAVMAHMLRGRQSHRAFFASLEQRVEDATAGLIRTLELAHGGDEYEAALDDASVEVALVCDAARELERNLFNWLTGLNQAMTAVDAVDGE